MKGTAKCRAEAFAELCGETPENEREREREREGKEFSYEVEDVMKLKNIVSVVCVLCDG